MSMYFVLDEQGDPLPVASYEEWARWCERSDRGVARTVIAPEVVVLTVFTGLNEAEVAPGEQPLLFDTCVLGGPLDGETVHHSNRVGALAEHEWLVEWCRLGNTPDQGVTEDQLR